DAIRKDLDVPPRLVTERAERRAAALRVRPQSLARVRAAIDEALPRDLDRREIALVPEDRVALHIASARSRAREREHLIGSAERFGRPQRDLTRPRARRERDVTVAVVNERACGRELKTGVHHRNDFDLEAVELELAARVVREAQLVATELVIRHRSKGPDVFGSNRRLRTLGERRGGCTDAQDTRRRMLVLAGEAVAVSA